MTEYGFGWYVDEYKGNRRYRHSGSTRGFRNGVQHLPALDVTVVFLSNRNEIGDALVDSIVEASVAAVRSSDNDHKP
jgi:CubicO group peptidase (beta-lactamase class C family)